MLAVVDAVQLSTHKQMFEQSSQLHECVVCIFLFQNIQSFTMSAAAKHSKGRRKQSKGKRFPCPYDCGESFEHKRSISRHIESFHSSEKTLFACPYACGKTFELQRSIQRHVDSVHRQIRYSCPIAGCNTTIARRHKMTEHYRDFHNMDPDQMPMLKTTYI